MAVFLSVADIANLDLFVCGNRCASYPLVYCICHPDDV